MTIRFILTSVLHILSQKVKVEEMLYNNFMICFFHRYNVYMFYDENPMVIMGDLNGRLGDRQDFNPMIDIGDIPQRQCIDNTTNRYGDYLIDFLSDSKTCVLNGVDLNCQKTISRV